MSDTRLIDFKAVVRRRAKSGSAVRGLLLAAVATVPLLAGAQRSGRGEQPPRSTAVRSLSTRELVARGVPASVTILALGADGDTLGVGSGFIVRPDGVIITNHHVLEGAHRAMLFRSNGEVLDRVTVLDADSLHDLAVLKATAVDLPTLSLARTSPAVGDRVVVIGAPLGLEHTVSDGIVSALRRDGVREQLQMSAPISPGSSGGPVLDVYGRVVGITRATIRAGQALNFAIPARYAAALLSDAQGRAPQSVAAVFGVASSGRTSPAPDGRGGRQPAGAPAPDAGGRLEVPPPSAAREHALTGTFITFTELTRRPSGGRDTVERGVAVLARDGRGFWAPRFSSKSVMVFHNGVVTGTGRVGLRAGRIPLEGWVTSDGWYVAGADPQDGLGLRIVAKPIDFSLGVMTGVYDVGIRTSSSLEGVRGDNIDWTGTAIVMAGDDSVWVDLEIENQRGGNTGAFIQTVISRDGQFDWSRGGKSLRGVIQQGRLEAEWVERRESGTVYRGTLRGARR